MISKGEVAAIIKLLENDPQARSTINSRLGNNDSLYGALIPDTWAGGVRNAYYMMTGKDPDKDMDTMERVCFGIASHAKTLIDIARRKQNADLQRIMTTGTVTRNEDAVLLPVHTATTITMVDGQTHVLDWHASLNIQNPVLYRSVLDFKADRSVQYRFWNGWK